MSYFILQELKLKDEQCEKLSRVRNELEAELEELTASLFQVCSEQQILIMTVLQIVYISCSSDH